MKLTLTLTTLAVLTLSPLKADVLYTTDTGSYSHGIPGVLDGTSRIWGAQSFVTDNSGRGLASVGVGYWNNDFSVTFTPRVQILADNANNPDVSSIVATLIYSGDTTVAGNSGSSLNIIYNGAGSITAPALNTDFRLVFTPSGAPLALSPNTKYWIAAGGAKTGGTGAAGVGIRDFDATASGPWYADQPLSNSDITSSSLRIFDGSNLASAPSFLMQAQINSGAVPEPSEYGIVFGGGLLALAAWRRKSAKA